MEKKVKVRNPKPHLVSVDGILYQPGEVKEVVLNDKVKYALEKGILEEVKPKAAAATKPAEEKKPTAEKKPAVEKKAATTQQAKK